MTRIVTATEAKRDLLRLLDEVEDGEDIQITRHGRPVARLCAAVGPKALKGSMAGTAYQTVPDELLFSTGEKWECS